METLNSNIDFDFERYIFNTDVIIVIQLAEMTPEGDAHHVAPHSNYTQDFKQWFYLNESVNDYYPAYTNTYQIGLFTSQDGTVETYFASEFEDSLSDSPVVDIVKNVKNGDEFEIIIPNDLPGKIYSSYHYGSKRQGSHDTKRAHGSSSKKITLEVVCGKERIKFFPGEYTVNDELVYVNIMLGPFSLFEDLPVIISLSTGQIQRDAEGEIVAMDPEPITVMTDDDRCPVNFISILDCVSESYEEDQGCRSHADAENPYPILIESP